MENPFRVGGQVAGAHFTDRADEVARVRRALAEPSRLLVYGPRRMGKSSLIAAAAAGVRSRGGVVGWLDFSTATALTDVSNRLLKSLSSELHGLPERLMELARSIRPTVSIGFEAGTSRPVVSFGVELRARPVEDQRGALESVLDRVEAFAASHEAPVALVLDEFQDILELGGDRADWFLRGVMQRHQHVSYVCAGSKESLIHEMLDRKRAFYKHFELLHVGPMPADHLVRWIDDRMRGAGVDPRGCGAALLRLAGPRTQDSLHLARELHTVALPHGRVRDGDLERAFDAIIRAEQAVYPAIWDELTAIQQNALRAIASDPEHYFAGEVARRFGIPSTSTLSRAVDALVARGLLVRSGRDIEFDSPFFRAWVRREVLPDVAPSGRPGEPADPRF